MMKIEIERETDGRWIAEVPDMPGVMAYGKTRKEAVAKVEALAERVIADVPSSSVAHGGSNSRRGHSPFRPPA
ncbi:MAG: type II toxin-antitoxin system HicB family antitoxin [Candidatus Brocadiia bacterium]